MRMNIAALPGNEVVCEASVKLFKLLLPNCKEATRLQSIALDRRLPLLQRCGLRFHLLICKWCRRYRSQVTFLRRMIQEHPDQRTETTPRELSSEARERLKQYLKNHAR